MKPPKDLDPTSRKLWRLVVADLTERGVLRVADAPAIASRVQNVCLKICAPSL